MSTCAGETGAFRTIVEWRARDGPTGSDQTDATGTTVDGHYEFAYDGTAAGEPANASKRTLSWHFARGP